MITARRGFLLGALATLLTSRVNPAEAQPNLTDGWLCSRWVPGPGNQAQCQQWSKPAVSAATVPPPPFAATPKPQARPKATPVKARKRRRRQRRRHR